MPAKPGIQGLQQGDDHPRESFLPGITSIKATTMQKWQYLNRWSKVRSPIDGRDLKTLGYKPGPLYKEILAELLAATLDGKIKDYFAV